MSDDEVPAWRKRLVKAEIASKAAARDLLKQCRAGTKHDTWDGVFFETHDGTFSEEDFERARDILMGVADRDPGRKGFHDWEKIDQLIDKAADELQAERPGSRVNRAEIRRRVAKNHPISETSSQLRKHVTDRMKASGR